MNNATAENKTLCRVVLSTYLECHWINQCFDEWLYHGGFFWIAIEFLFRSARARVRSLAEYGAGFASLFLCLLSCVPTQHERVASTNRTQFLFTASHGPQFWPKVALRVRQRSHSPNTWPALLACVRRIQFRWAAPRQSGNATDYTVTIIQ